MRECFGSNGSAQNGSKTSCKREAYPNLRGTVPYRTVPKSRVNVALISLSYFAHKNSLLKLSHQFTISSTLLPVEVVSLNKRFDRKEFDIPSPARPVLN